MLLQRVKDFMLNNNKERPSIQMYSLALLQNCGAIILFYNWIWVTAIFPPTRDKNLETCCMRENLYTAHPAFLIPSLLFLLSIYLLFFYPFLIHFSGCRMVYRTSYWTLHLQELSIKLWLSTAPSGSKSSPTQTIKMRALQARSLGWPCFLTVRRTILRSSSKWILRWTQRRWLAQT